MLTRRNFLKLSGASSLAWYVATRGGWMQRATAQIPGGTLDPGDVAKFQTAMLIPPVMPRAATITMPGGKPADYYEISMRQFQEQILPAGMPATTVWGYGAVKSASRRGLLLHHAPSLTIEATWKRPVRVKWINELMDAGGHYRPHLLPVDPTLHWANPPGGAAGRDTRPDFTGMPTPGPYTGPVQDRSFNADGSLFYPDTRAFFDGITQYIPTTDVSPIWNPEFFGNMIMVNGNTWPFQTVEQRRYRLRVLNGCQSRFLILDFGGIPGVEVWQIGNEGGFLADPVNLTADNGNRLLLGLAERADLIVDFTGVPVGDYVLGNVGPDEPFGGGTPGVDFEAANPGSTGQVLQFRVVPAVAPDPTTPPRFLVLPAITRLAGGTTRPLALLERASAFFEDAPVEAMLGTVQGDPTTAPAAATPRMWMDPVTENPAVGATEVWEYYNATADAHPMHVHEVAFQVVNRQAVIVNKGVRDALHAARAQAVRDSIAWVPWYFPRW